MGRSKIHLDKVNQHRQTQEFSSHKRNITDTLSFTTMHLDRNPVLGALTFWLLLSTLSEIGEAKQVKAASPTDLPNSNKKIPASIKKIPSTPSIKKLSSSSSSTPLVLASLNVSQKAHTQNKKLASPSSFSNKKAQVTQNPADNNVSPIKKGPSSKESKSLKKNTTQLSSQVNAENWVIVRVWLPRNADGTLCVAHGSDDRIGHASLQTKNIYASFWPIEPVSTTHGIFGIVGGTFVATPRDDERSEGNVLPDVLIPLYSLDIDRIEKTFIRFKESCQKNGGCNWSLLGKNIFNGFNSKDAQSCAGLVYDLLVEGGIFNLEVNSDLTRDWITVSPDAIARMVVSAEVNERKIYPITEDFDPPVTPIRLSTNYKDYDQHKLSRKIR